MSVLRFFFVHRFNRFDVAVIVAASVFVGAKQIGPIAAIAFIFGGMLLSAIGEYILARRQLDAR